MAEILISRATMLNTLQVVFSVQDDGKSALTARVRLLGTVGVPSKERSSPNKHLQYGLLELTEIAMALALMNAHVPQLVAARYVRERWDDFAALAISGLNEALSPSVRDEFNPANPTPVAVIEGNILASLGARTKNDRVEELPLAGIRLFDDLRGMGARLSTASAIVIDAKAFMPKLLRLMRAFRHSDDDLREMMFRLVNSRGQAIEFG
jgi:hypothetical protein